MYFHRTLVAVGLCLLFAGVASAQVSSTRTTSYDWQCQDASGARISDHQREGSAIVACLNAPNGAYVQGGRYRITKPVTPTTPTPSTGTATLSWTPPTTGTDGRALTSLAGYRLSYGASPTALTQVVQIASPGASSYALSNLTPGTYYFSVRAYTSTGTESAQSNVVSKTIL